MDAGASGLNSDHYILSHDENGYKCSICTKSFSHLYKLTRHVYDHTIDREYPCHICGRAFRQRATLNQHFSTHSTERPFACEACEKRFSRLSSLISHRKIHYEKKIYSCDYCEKSFYQKGNLRHHVFSHTNERPYKCLICNVGFNQKSNLTSHIKKKHSEFVNVAHEKFKRKININPQRRFQENDQKYFPLEKQVIDDLKKITPLQSTMFVILKYENEKPVIAKIEKIENQYMLMPVTNFDFVSFGSLDDKTLNDIIEAINTTKASDETYYINLNLSAIVYIQKPRNGNLKFEVQVQHPSAASPTIKNSIT